MTTGRSADVMVSERHDALLCVEGLSAGYRGADVLHDISLEVAGGELLGVIGPNGSGKSTLVRAITRVIRPSAGRVLLGGSAATAMSPAAIARYAAVVPQAPALPAGFTGLEFVLLGRTPHLRLLASESPRDVEIGRRALARCDASHLAGRRLEAMSGGERQRLLLARALAQEPLLLLLDEPTTHLDITHQVRVLELVLEQCRADGLAALVVVHDLTLAAQYCDRLVLIGGGRIVARGTPAEVLTAERIASVYGARVGVLAHPETGRPVVVPLGGAIAPPVEEKGAARGG
jgi:iron complex transport system ATP-binding protein